jgi:hypothetical protein
MSSSNNDQHSAPTLGHLNLIQLKDVCDEVAKEAALIAKDFPENKLAILVEKLALVIEAYIYKEIY